VNNKPAKKRIGKAPAICIDHDPRSMQKPNEEKLRQLHERLKKALQA